MVILDHLEDRLNLFISYGLFPHLKYILIIIIILLLFFFFWGGGEGETFCSLGSNHKKGLHETLSTSVYQLQLAQCVTWRDQLITAFIKLLFKSGGGMPAVKVHVYVYGCTWEVQFNSRRPIRGILVDITLRRPLAADSASQSEDTEDIHESSRNQHGDIVNQTMNRKILYLRQFDLDLMFFPRIMSIT